ncbi:MAG: response regulator [Anaerolineaceae bacterium]|nr:response regulator [Anaerolineaceae bacterium]
MAKILVVDDEKHMRDFLSDTLYYAGYSVVIASDGVSGAQLAEEHVPDLIVSDIYMPHLDGFGMLEHIRALSKTSTIPVIFLTAENRLPTLRKGMLHGAEDYITKPVSPSDLLSAIQVQLDKRTVLEEKHHSTLRLLRKNILYALPHELRTPLHLISGYANLLEIDQGKSTPEEVLECAHYIRNAGKRLEELIENYLILAQLELIHANPTDLQAAQSHFVKDSGKIIATIARERAQAFNRVEDLQVDVCNLALRISEQDLGKIIQELMDNAFKFSKPGSPVLVRSKCEEDQLRIMIRDEGRGMSYEEVEMLGAYMQFGRELYEQQGAGLGFTVARRLVELHSGAIKVDSQPQEGTAVSVRFSLI